MDEPLTLVPLVAEGLEFKCLVTMPSAPLHFRKLHRLDGRIVNVRDS